MLLPNDLHKNPLLTSSIKFIVEDVLPWSQMQRTVCDCQRDFASHELTFQVSVCVVLSSSIVMVHVGRCVKWSESFEQQFVVVMKAAFVVIDEHACRDVHWSNQAESIFDTALCHQSFDFAVNGYNRPAFGDLHPEFFRERLQSSFSSLKSRSKTGHYSPQPLIRNTVESKTSFYTTGSGPAAIGPFKFFEMSVRLR